MHNGRVLKHGTPDEIENDAEVQAIYLGGGRHDELVLASPRRGGSGPILQVDRLDVYYGRAHALQGVSLTPRSRRAGRRRPQRHGQDDAVQRHHRPGAGLAAAIQLAGAELLGLPPHRITRLGVGYVPQGRRVWPSLTVDEHLRLAAAQRPARRVDDRAHLRDSSRGSPSARGNGGAQLSGGEQQMLAIGRALLFNPRLLVMDEPTEGLAPVIVEQVADDAEAAGRRGRDRRSCWSSRTSAWPSTSPTRVAVMVNGRIARMMPAAELAADRDLQQRLLGVRDRRRCRGGDRSRRRQRRRTPRHASSRCVAPTMTARCRTRPRRRRRRTSAPCAASRAGTRRDTTVGPRDQIVSGRAEPVTAPPSLEAAAASLARTGREARVVELPVATTVRPRRLRRRHLRHQGPRAALPAQLPGEARPAHRHRRSRDLGHAVAGIGAAARGGAASSRRRARRVHRRPRLGGDGRWPMPSSASS